MQGCRGTMDSKLSIAVGYRSAAAARRDLSCDGPSSQSNQRVIFLSRFQWISSQEDRCGGKGCNITAVSGRVLNRFRALPAAPTLTRAFIIARFPGSIRQKTGIDYGRGFWSMQSARRILAVVVLYKMTFDQSRGVKSLLKALSEDEAAAKTIELMVCDNTPYEQAPPADFSG